MPLKSQPLRTCTGCGEKKEKTRMVRVVADPSGRFIPDLKGSMPSRGAYVCPDANCITKAVGGRLAVSLKVSRNEPGNAGDLKAAIAAAYRQRVLSLLGQARKSGRVTSGTSLVEGELRRGGQQRWFGLIALDASSNIAEKIEKALERASVPYRIFLYKEKLGDAVGKSPRSVVLVRDENMARVIQESVDRCQSILSNGGLDQ
jgi:predicted RNA-binding protein YlxR (DUF448 family)